MACALSGAFFASVCYECQSPEYERPIEREFPELRAEAVGLKTQN